MARTAGPSSDVPLLKVLYKRLRLMRKKHTRITQTEERLAQGKALNSDQEEILKSKPVVTAILKDLEDLHSAALPGDLLSSTPVTSTEALEKPSQDIVAAPSSDVPVLKLLYKKLGLLRKRRTRAIQMAERVAQGQALHKEQEEILKSEPVVTALIQELENLHSAALSEELSSSTPVASTEAEEKPLQDVVVSPSLDVPVLKFLSKRLSLLRKQRTRVIQIEKRVAKGEALNRDEKEVLKSKSVITALIEELVKLRSVALPEDLSFSNPAAVVESTVVPNPVLEPVSETPLQVDAATTDSQPKDEADLNTLDNITAAPQEEQEPEAVVQQQNPNNTEQEEKFHIVPRKNLKNTRIDGRRDGRGGYHFGRGQYYDNRYHQRNYEYQNDEGQYYGNGYNQRDFEYHNEGYPRYYRNGGEYNDSGYYSRNSYDTRGRGAGRGVAAAQRAPNKDVPAQRAPNNHVAEQRGINQGSNNGVAEQRRPNRGPNNGVAAEKGPNHDPKNASAEQV